MHISSEYVKVYKQKNEKGITEDLPLLDLIYVQLIHTCASYEQRYADKDIKTLHKICHFTLSAL